MPSVKLSPVFNDAQLASSTGAPLAGGKLYWYISGTTTPLSTYTDSSGATPQTNPIILNVRGEPDYPIWLQVSNTYKAVLKDSLDNIIRTIDNIQPINDVSTPAISEWVLYAGAATFISNPTGSTSRFSVSGDQTATLTVGRRIKAAVSGGEYYGTIDTSVYGAVTTVTLTDDSLQMDSGLNAIYYGFMDPTHWSFGFPGGTVAQHVALADPHTQYLLESNIIPQATAEAGTDTAAYAWNALRVRQAIYAVTESQYRVLQTVTATKTTYSSYAATPAIPYDNSLPQNTEGVEVLSLSITPKSSSSKILVDVLAYPAAPASGGGLWTTVATFIDTTADALSATSALIGTGGGIVPSRLYAEYANADVTAKTFKIRIGVDAVATVYCNGDSGGGKFNGGLITSIKLTEVKS